VLLIKNLKSTSDFLFLPSVRLQRRNMKKIFFFRNFIWIIIKSIETHFVRVRAHFQHWLVQKLINIQKVFYLKQKFL
jgi:hypothetical protein